MLDCDMELLLTLQRQVEPAVSEIAEIHFNFTSGRQQEVIERMSVFQVNQLCKSAISVLESLRLTMGSLVCPAHFDDGSGQRSSSELPEHLRPSKFVQQFFSDVRQLARSGTTEIYTPEVVAQIEASWHSSALEFLNLAQRLEAWVVESRRSGGRMQASTFTSVETLVERFMNMALDFVRSLAEDMGLMFRAPNYVPRELTPAGASDTDEHLAENSLWTVDVFRDSVDGLALKPEFLNMLLQMPAPLAHAPLHPDFKVCESLPEVTSVPLGTSTEFLDEVGGWAHRDITGTHRRDASPLQLLQAAASRGTRLSNLFISVQVSPYLLTPTPYCGATLTLYDPSHCLVERKWAGYFFHLNPMPPFNVSVVYVGRPLGPGSDLPSFEVHHIPLPSMDTQWNSLVSLFKSMNHHSPDTLFLSPFVGNCQIIDRLMRTGTIKPKILYLPINPLVPPGHHVKPDFFKWWDEHGFVFMRQVMEGISATGDDSGLPPVTTSIWLAQCSLSAGIEVVSGYGYELLHVEHTYAVFLWRPLYKELELAKASGSTAGASVDVREAWLRGWHCSPMARFVFDLEIWGKHSVPEEMRLASASESAFEDQPGSDRAMLRRYAASVMTETPALRYLLERGAKNNGNLQRGHCGEGLCECLPPFRGPLCELEDPPRVQQKLRAVIHYITAETERDLQDLERSLTSLWIHFNKGYDYPVVIFHEGLSNKGRERIVAASENRVWLALVPRFKEVPPEWAEVSRQRASEFAVGYRAMTRWRSGPVFLEPALAGFDYAMTLDTDSYFPGPLGEDPFEVLHAQGLAAMFPHLGRESASVVVNFMHYFLLYCRLQKLDPRRTRMLAALIEKNYKWYQQCLMLDIEILRLDWFRGPVYQDFFRYMDSVGGFWIHRWGNNPVRTFAVTLLLEDKDVRTAFLPYAHQDFCSCGAGRACQWISEKEEYTCDEKSEPAAIAMEELAEGLLDLQPWRGSARQLSRQSQQMDVIRFASGQT